MTSTEEAAWNRAGDLLRRSLNREDDWTHAREALAERLLAGDEARFSEEMVVAYKRNCDGSIVTGVIAEVYPPFWHKYIPHLREAWAYRLRLDKDTADRVGHPVTIAQSRILTEDHGYEWSPDGPECGLCGFIHRYPDPEQP